MMLSKSIRALLLVFIMGASMIIASHAALPYKDGDGKELPTLAPMLNQVNSAVVNIATFTTQRVNQNPLLNDPYFRYFFNAPNQRQFRQPQRKQSAGSGVIVDADNGIVITNHHVIKGADEINVSLTDGRSFAAKLIGSDPELDIAVLEIDADNLSEIKFADSSALQVGDFVVAIGNPFGLGQTVTTGIVSALGRSNLGIEGYENFIQTDASINPGNSGGALVNLNGELVGINTAIISPAGGNVGIGFAIPINMARLSMDQIIDHGEVKRGQIGVGIQELTPELRDAFGLANGQRGVLVTSISPGSTAEQAGIQSGDIIIAVEGKPVHSTGQLRSQLGVREVGKNVKLTVIRNREPLQLTVKIGKPEGVLANNREDHRLLEGAVFQNNPAGQGVVVSQVAPGSAAARGGLRPGDVITGLNRNTIDDVESFSKLLPDGDKPVLLRIRRNGSSLYLVIR